MKYWMTTINGMCPDDGVDATRVLSLDECQYAAKHIKRRYPNINATVLLNTIPWNTTGCIAECDWDRLDSKNCYDRETTYLRITWQNNTNVFGRGSDWRPICKSVGRVH